MESLVEFLSPARRVYSGRAAKKISEYKYLSFANGHLEVSSDEMTIRKPAPDLQGEWAIPMPVLNHLEKLRRKDEYVHLAIQEKQTVTLGETDTEQHLVIETEFAEIETKIESEAKTPRFALPEQNITHALTLTTDEVSRIWEVGKFCSKDRLKPVLTGVFLRLREGEIEAVATDGHRLYWDTDFPGTVESDEAVDLLVKAEPFVVARKYMEKSAELWYSDQGAGKRFYLRLDTGMEIVFCGPETDENDQYPDYRSVMTAFVEPDEDLAAEYRYTDFVVLNREALIERCRVVKEYVGTTYQMTLGLWADPEKVSIEAEEQSYPIQISAEMPTVLPTRRGKPLQLGLNAKYLLQILKDIEGENVWLWARSDISAIFLQSEEVAQQQDRTNEVLTPLYLQMPVRLNK